MLMLFAVCMKKVDNVASIPGNIKSSVDGVITTGRKCTCPRLYTTFQNAWQFLLSVRILPRFASSSKYPRRHTHTHIQTLELLSQAGKNLVGAVEGANLSARTGDSQIIVFKCFYDLSLEAVPLDPLGFSTVGPFNFWFQLLEVVTLRPVSILARRNAILAFETCSLRAMVGHGRPFSPFFFCVLPGLICSEIGILPLLL